MLLDSDRVAYTATHLSTDRSFPPPLPRLCETLILSHSRGGPLHHVQCLLFFCTARVGTVLPGTQAVLIGKAAALSRPDETQTIPQMMSKASLPVRASAKRRW